MDLAEQQMALWSEGQAARVRTWLRLVRFTARLSLQKLGNCSVVVAKKAFREGDTYRIGTMQGIACFSGYTCGMCGVELQSQNSCLKTMQLG
eukprot:1147972-Pelagomonas_calceolata.AAC.2